jgi:hypothetical protein
MCKPCSMIALRHKIHTGSRSESHEEIIAEHKIAMDGVRGPNGVRVELTPPNETDYETPLDKWVFRVDQDEFPKWWDAVEAESRCRTALPAWAAAKLVLVGQVRCVVEGDHIVSVRGGTVQEVRGGTVQEVRGGTVQEVSGGTVQYVTGGTVQKIVQGMVRFFSSFSCKLSGSFAVLIDCTGTGAVCHVGTEEEKTITNGMADKPS